MRPVGALQIVGDHDRSRTLLNALQRLIRSKGLFAGISLEGSTLRSDGGANEKLYGQKLTAKEIIRDGKVEAPASASELVALLDEKSPKNRSDPKSLD